MNIKPLMAGAALLLLPFYLKAQYSQPVYSSSDYLIFEAPDKKKISSEDELTNQTGGMYRFAKGLPVDLSALSQGKWTPVGAMLTWQLSVEVPDAYALGVYFNDFHLPDHAVLTLHSPDLKEKIVLDNSSNDPNRSLLSRFISGSVIGITLQIKPEDVQNLGLNISEIVYVYRPWSKDLQKNFGDAGSCLINVNCTPEGDNWQDEKRSVVRIEVKEGTNYGWCTGSLINNTAQDCTPYILTANHCGGAASSADFIAWRFYFNYEAPGCTNPATEGSLASNFITTAIKLSNAADISDVSKSDFMLLLMKNRPTAATNAYFAAWNKNNTTSASGVGIHHPSGDIKKISTYTGNLQNSTWSGTPGTHWALDWATTANGQSVTEPGSSGSPLFNSAGQLIGVLSGGSSCCTVGGCGNPFGGPNSTDLYGKFSYSWDQTGTTPNRRLKEWLDKANTNVAVVSGKNASTCSAVSLPVVDFVADNTTVTVGQTVNFTDQSTGNPFAWAWTFSNPTAVTYLNSTTVNSQNPSVSFGTAGNYSVTLNAGNSSGIVNKLKTLYIKVLPLSVENSNKSEVAIFPVPANDVLNISNLQGKALISIIDLNGKVVRNINTSSETFVTLPISDLPNGVWVLSIKQNSQITTKRFIVSR